MESDDSYQTKMRKLLAKRKEHPKLCRYERKVKQQRIAFGFPADEVINNRKQLRPQMYVKPDPKPKVFSGTDSEAEEAEEEYLSRKSRVPEVRKYVSRRKAPLPIPFSSPVFCFDFAPSRPIITAGLVSGAFQLFSYSQEKGNFMIGGLKQHKQSIRNLKYSEDSSRIFCCSSDKSISIVDTQYFSVAEHWKDAHTTAVNRITFFNPNTLASGDDNGCIKIWDIRQKEKLVAEYQEHTNFISDFIVNGPRFLLATSSDGRMSTYDVRKRKIFMVSENQEEELLCGTITKHGSKIAIGTSAGNLRIFNWGQFAEISDQFPMVHRTPSTFCEFIVPTMSGSRSFAAGSDGRVRVVNFFPHKIVAEVGSHSKGYPIEYMAVSGDQNILATAGHDQKIRFWDVSQYQKAAKKPNKYDDSDSSDEEEDATPTTTPSDANPKNETETIEEEEEEEEEKPKLLIKPKRGFFSGF